MNSYEMRTCTKCSETAMHEIKKNQSHIAYHLECNNGGIMACDLWDYSYGIPTLQE